jgi:predicted nucleotide-binding protein (sugar kinase/HSP70/actin superfamily)
MTGELIGRYAHSAGKPFLNLTLDEHTGEAGVMTRLEAFWDMVNWRKAVGT